MYQQDEIYGERLLISIHADQTELKDNIRAARVLLRCFDDCYIIHQNKAVVLKAEVYHSANKETIRELISDVLIKLRT